MTILIVEDDPEVREMVALLLHDEGYEVALAGEGRQALALLRTRSDIVLVLTDLMMPMVDGWALIELMRTSASFALLPIVVMTGVVAPDRLPREVTLLSKPFRIDELIRAVRTASQEIPPASWQSTPEAPSGVWTGQAASVPRRTSSIT